ncbi:hypothetical protein DICA3_F36334 [Diutina catenulata]
MPISTAGLVLSGLMGALTRRLQVTLVGKTYERSASRLTGYALSMGVFVGGYYVLDQFKQRNAELLQRRLAVLREQRAKKDIFYEFADEGEHRLTADKRGRFFQLMDKYGAAYQ